MKIFYPIILLFICITSYSQTTTSQNKRTKTAKHLKKNTIQPSLPAAQPRITITEQYLKGTGGKYQNTDTAAKSKGNKSPFAGGIHAAADAGEKFDTVSSITNNAAPENIAGVPVAAPNDTVFNSNTINNNGITTNSGAVDRSGQAQFGQTNWGNSRSTVGQSQWTIPPPVSASFSKEFPTAGDLFWTRNSTDTSLYSARYKSGDRWVTSNYNTSGQRLDMRTEVPLTLLPQRVNAYISKLPANLPVTTISKWQVLGKADVYEIQTKTGKTIYVTDEGTEINR